MFRAQGDIRSQLNQCWIQEGKMVVEKFWGGWIYDSLVPDFRRDSNWEGNTSFGWNMLTLIYVIHWRAYMIAEVLWLEQGKFQRGKTHLFKPASKTVPTVRALHHSLHCQTFQQRWVPTRIVRRTAGGHWSRSKASSGHRRRVDFALGYLRLTQTQTLPIGQIPHQAVRFAAYIALQLYTSLSSVFRC
jgi:hypothetical protein